MFLLEAIGVHVQKDTNIVERERRVKEVNIQKEAEQGLLIALALLYGSGCGVGRSHTPELSKPKWDNKSTRLYANRVLRPRGSLSSRYRTR